MPESPPDPHRWWRRPWYRGGVRHEVDEELALHVALLARDYAARGMPPSEAQAAAQRRFGDRAALTHECVAIATARERQMRRLEWWDAFRQDLARGWRQLRRAPGFAAVALLTLALGVGATTAIFSVVHAVVLRPLPFDRPERVVRFRSTELGAEWEKQNFAPGQYGAWARSGRSWERIAMNYPGDFTLTGVDTPERLAGARVSADYFHVFGVAASLGRGFAASDDRPGAPRVAVLSHRLWERRFGGRPGAVGETVELNGERYAVVGVMPARFDFTADAPELWIPAALSDDALRNLGGRYIEVVGRLRPGVSVAAANSEAVTIERAIFAASPEREHTGTVRVLDYTEDLTHDYRAQLLVLLGAAGAVLLIACVNVANLLAARGLAREREFAIRAALGAGAGRIVRQLATETAVLAFAGAAAGVALAAGGVRVLARYIPAGVPRVEQARLDGAALLVALGLAVATTLLIGILPARRRGRRERLQLALAQGGRSAGAGAVRRGPRAALVAGEVALALVLLVGSGLLIRSALILRRVSPGVDAERVLTARVTLPELQYRQTGAVVRTFQQIVDQAASIPGVTTAAAVSRVPLAGMNTGVGFVRAGDADALQNDRGVGSNFRLVTPGYFRTMGIPVTAGRDFATTDGPGAPKAVVVNRALAAALGLGANPVGSRIWSNNSAFWYGDSVPTPLEVVGVVGDVRDDGVREDVRPEAYFPIAQAPDDPWGWLERTMLLVASTRGDPAALARPLQAAVQTVDSRLPLYDVRSMAGRLADASALDRFYTGLLSALGAAALLLAAVGIYGVVAHLVGRQAPEVGIRLALGSTAGAVLRLMVRRHMRPVAAGIALGGAGALLAARALAARLYGVPPTDPLTLLAAAAVLATVALLACWLPARRAARLDPARVLRAE